MKKMEIKNEKIELKKTIEQTKSLEEIFWKDGKIVDEKGNSLLVETRGKSEVIYVYTAFKDETLKEFYKSFSKKLEGNSKYSQLNFDSFLIGNYETKDIFNPSLGPGHIFESYIPFQLYKIIVRKEK